MRNGIKVFGVGLLAVGMIASASFADYSIRLASQTPTGGYEEAAFGGSTIFVSPNTSIGAVDILNARVGQTAVELTLSPHGASAAATMIRQHAGSRIAIFNDRTIIAAPMVQADILKGATLTGITAPLPPVGPTLSVTASKTSVAAGEMVSFDVFVSQTSDLRGYQVALEATGGKAGSLQVVDIAQDTARQDWVFGTQQIVNAVDLNGSRMVAALFSGSLDVTAPKYVGTFTFQPSKDAQGSFAVKVKVSEETALRDSNSNPIGYQAGPAAVINVGAGK